jgi:hypothetical protein
MTSPVLAVVRVVNARELARRPDRLEILFQVLPLPNHFALSANFAPLEACP